jgi:hypothetical protein
VNAVEPCLAEIRIGEQYVSAPPAGPRVCAARAPIDFLRRWSFALGFALDAKDRDVALLISAGTAGDKHPVVTATLWAPFTQTPSARVCFPISLNGLSDFSPVHGCPKGAAVTYGLICSVTGLHDSTSEVKMRLVRGL